MSFIVPQELHVFSGTMAVFAIESPFWRIVAEKEPCFCGTMMGPPVADGFLDILSANVISDLTLCLTIGLEPISYD